MRNRILQRIEDKKKNKSSNNTNSGADVGSVFGSLAIPAFALGPGVGAAYQAYQYQKDPDNYIDNIVSTTKDLYTKGRSALKSAFTPTPITEEQKELSYMPPEIKNSSIYDKLYNLSDSNKKKLYKEYSSVMDEFGSNMSFGDQVSSFKNFDTDSIKEIQDDANISNEELRKYLYKMDDYKKLNSMEKMGVKSALYLKGFKKGGMYPMTYNMGGVQQLPGGQMQQIPGTDAVEFIGASHDDGGIMVDNQTEVEGGETMDQVTMAKKGGKRDYFFSDHLKHGGIPFAQHHKNILANGGTQEDIDYLAKMQEKAAGRTPSKIATAKLGGVVKYEDGGEGKFPVASYETYGGLEDEYGAVADYQPGLMVNGVQMYADKDDEEFRKLLQQENFSSDWMNNVDPEVLKAAGITNFDDMSKKENVIAYQTAWNEANPDNKIDVDGKFGEQTFRTAKVSAPDETPTEDPTEDPKLPTEYTTSTTVTNDQKKDYSSTLLGLGSMIPAVMAFTEKPDYMEEADLQAPGIVKAERISKQHLDRVDLNDQLARNASDAAAVNEYINTSGGGPASMANKMALYAQKQQGDRDIKAQEAKANIAISNEENVLDNKRKAYNAEAQLDASKFNVQSQEAASSSNIRNKMYVDEYNSAADAATKDRKLMAVQYGLNTLVQLNRDKQTKAAADNLAKAVDGQRGALDRFFAQNTTTTTNTTNPNVTESKRGGWRQMKLKRK